VMNEIKNDFLKLPDYLKKEEKKEPEAVIEQSELF